MKMKYEEVQAEKALELSPHHHADISTHIPVVPWDVHSVSG